MFFFAKLQCDFQVLSRGSSETFFASFGSMSHNKSLQPRGIRFSGKKCEARNPGPPSGFLYSLLLALGHQKPPSLVWIWKSVSPRAIMMSRTLNLCILSHFGPSRQAWTLQCNAWTFERSHAKHHHTLGVSWNTCSDLQLQHHKSIAENHTKKQESAITLRSTRKNQHQVRNLRK